jgi:hypothetical protein
MPAKWAVAGGRIDRRRMTFFVDGTARLTEGVRWASQLAIIVRSRPIGGNKSRRRRACDLIMRLHEEFGISVSDDTVYRALKELGFSHVSTRPKAYKQDPEAMEAFKKTFPHAWRRSARSLRPAHR